MIQLCYENENPAWTCLTPLFRLPQTTEEPFEYLPYGTVVMYTDYIEGMIQVIYNDFIGWTFLRCGKSL